MPLSSGSKVGPYEIVGLLGAGGMGEVYRARDPRLGRDVAIKVLPVDRLADEDRRARFVREARAASALNHPNIVTIYEIENADGIDFIVMEYVPGKSLDALIGKQGMRLGDLLKTAIPLADALARAHARGIVHRDLKPANVIVSNEGVVKVLDFGLAKLMPVDGSDESTERETRTLDPQAGPLSRPGLIAGTAAYMAPEQATGGKVDARSDVFAFGVVLYEMVTGRRPFSGNSTAETLAAVVRDHPKPPSELVATVPRDLEKVILRCLRKEPDRRFQHMLDAKVELEEIKEESDSGVLAHSLSPRRRFPAARAGLLVLLGVSAILAVAARGWRRRPVGEVTPPMVVVPLTSTPGRETEPTFAPDGDQMAFSWEGEKGGNWDIYLKMVGSSEARRLTTDPAPDRLPTWSRDGRQIAFVRFAREGENGTIFLMSPLGGSPRQLSDEPVGFGRLSWSPDGRILATAAGPDVNETRSENPIRGVRFVEATSGAIRVVTAPKAPAFHSDPAFSPDGSHLAYAACFGLFSCQIEVIDLGADYTPKGEARRVTGKAFWMGGLAWTRDGASLVYSDALSGRFWRTGLAGDQPPVRIEVAGYDAYWPTTVISRDRLAFEHSQHNYDIYRFSEGRPVEVAAASSFSDLSPYFSPIGDRFAFESARGGEGGEIWVAASDGSNPVQLTHGPGVTQGSPRWSPDGRRIAFDSQAADGRWDIWTIAADGGSLQRVTSGPNDHNLPSWSRDGRFIYFTSNRTGDLRIWRAPATGGPEEQVTRTGGWLAYESTDGQTLFFLQNRGPSPLMAMPVGGGTEREVIKCVGADWGFAVSAALIYHLGCGSDPALPLYRLDPRTGRDELLGKLDNAQGGLTVSPDGRTVLFTRLMGEGTDLMLIENFK